MPALKVPRHISAAATLCSAAHTKTATPSMHGQLSRKVVRSERQKIYNRSLEDEAEAEIDVEPPVLVHLPSYEEPASRSRGGKHETQPTVNATMVGSKPIHRSVRSVRAGLLPGQMVTCKFSVCIGGTRTTGFLH
mmetsp:Transcript_65689/g.106498  ORF Transcript_65689/g.106498 Transcript_65689/m.106498 type:complete len:135 (+) Transcript_65689:96-500(+)